MATSWTNNRDGYGWLSLSLHWLMLVLLAAAYATMELKGVFPKGSPGRAAMAFWHYSLGLTVFALVWLRLAVHLAGSKPEVAPPMPAWQARAARIAQGLLYLLMAALPLLGWLALSTKGGPVPWFGLELPLLLDEDRALSKTFKNLHEIGATAGYLVVGVHAAAALFHHYVLRDNTLRLMLPRR
jgi:cytochrome b561